MTINSNNQHDMYKKAAPLLVVLFLLMLSLLLVRRESGFLNNPLGSEVDGKNEIIPSASTQKAYLDVFDDFTPPSPIKRTGKIKACYSNIQLEEIKNFYTTEGSSFNNYFYFPLRTNLFVVYHFLRL